MGDNILERAIGFFSPSWGLKRSASRAALEVMNERRFEGVGRGDRWRNWRRPNTGPKTATTPYLTDLRRTSRDLVRNNPWAKNAVEVIVNNTVGYGIEGVPCGWDELPTTKARAKKLESLWQRWADSTQCDITGRHDLAGLQALALREIVESGEVLIRRVWVRKNGHKSVPLKLQVLESDYLDTTMDSVTLQNGNNVNGGIEYNAHGAPVAYYIWQDHPGDETAFSRGYKSVRIPATEIIHAFDTKRAGQGRGFPWGAAAIKRLKDFDDYEDAQLIRQKIASCFSIFIHDSAAGQTGLMGGNDKPPIDSLSPGLIETLPPGKNITFAQPPGTHNYSEYSRTLLLGVAAAFGVTYEALTADYSGVNFSSGRMGWLEMGRNVARWQSDLMQVQILQRVDSWFMEAAEISGYDVADLYLKWMPPKREMIDPTREIPAAIKGLRAGLTSLPRLHAQMGQDVAEVLEEIADTNKVLDKLNITLDSDPRRTNAEGGVREDLEDTQAPKTKTDTDTTKKKTTKPRE